MRSERDAVPIREFGLELWYLVRPISVRGVDGD